MRRFGQSEDGQRVDCVAGEEIELVLPENPTTGFRWHLTGDQPALRVVASDFEPPEQARPGAGSRHRWRLRADRPGDAHLVAELRSPGRRAAPAPGYSLHVHVEARSR